MLTIILTILITENMFLFFLLTIYLYRHCQRCSKVKEIDRVFNRWCSTCQNSPKNETKKYTEL